MWYSKKSQIWTLFDQNECILTLCGLFFLPIHKTLNYNRVSILLISLLFLVRDNPNPDAVAEPTLTRRCGTDPTRQAAALPKTFQPAQLLRQP